MDSKAKYPSEIRLFFDTVFELYEIRGRVGNVDGIKFEIRSKESNHNIPHVHAEYGEFNISIEIESGKVLAGNLPNKNKKKAVDWVFMNKNELLTKWKDIAISTKSDMTKSKLKL